ncbi:MAG: ribbon-helix-helix protein, CopG family [Crenarchaeota archaeon]|nr:ribbon-helix-helix protein, CopG family [Thermoproteota archaeon]
MRKERVDNRGIRLPAELALEMDKLIGTRGFRSRAEVAKTAIREFLEKYPARSEEA